MSLPGLHGVKAWGTYAKVKKGLKVHVCAEDTAKGVFASGAVLVASNSTGKFSMNLGAVAFGYHQSICRDMTLCYSAHVQVYTFTANNKGGSTTAARPRTSSELDDKGRPRRAAAAGLVVG